MVFRVNNLHRLPAAEKPRAPGRTGMLAEAALYIGGHTGIQAAITGLDHVDIPLCIVVLGIRGQYSLFR